jgi:hypothetical protein
VSASVGVRLQGKALRALEAVPAYDGIALGKQSTCCELQKSRLLDAEQYPMTRRGAGSLVKRCVDSRRSAVGSANALEFYLLGSFKKPDPRELSPCPPCTLVDPELAGQRFSARSSGGVGPERSRAARSDQPGSHKCSGLDRRYLWLFAAALSVE